MPAAYEEDIRRELSASGRRPILATLCDHICPKGVKQETTTNDICPRRYGRNYDMRHDCEVLIVERLTPPSGHIEPKTLEASLERQ
jgi:chorismate-pyruvate lyase